jgi:hypothetical protein
MTTPDGESERVRREDPERGGPQRGTNPFFQGSDAVTGVLHAYRVLAEYLRVGEQAARDHANGSGSAGAAAEAPRGASTSDWTPGAGAWAGLGGIPIQLFQAWTQMVATWADLTPIPNAGHTIRQMARMVETMWALVGLVPPPASEASAAVAPPKPGKLHVVIELAASMPCEVDVEFDPPEGVQPRLQQLHTLRGDAPPLSGHELHFDAASGVLRLQLAVPPNQPRGRYTGIVFDERDDRACGSVRVRVGDP